MIFKEAGYQVFHGCYSNDEVTAASEAIEQLCKTLRPGDPLWEKHVTPLSVLSEQRNPGVEDSVRLSETPFLLGDLPLLSPIFAKLVTQSALWAAAAKVLESDRIVYHFANATRKPAAIGPNMSWHRDFPNKHICPRHSAFIRALIPLEGMDEDNGCTEVIPGTHCLSDAEVIEANERKIRDHDLTRAIPVILAPGDMVAIHSKVVHGGGVNRSSRRRNLVVVQLGIETDDFLWNCAEPYTGFTRDEILRQI